MPELRALVTGGGGFIGSHIVRRLLEDGRRVRVLDNFSTGHRQNLQEVIGDIEIVEGDIQSYERCHLAVRDCDVVFHQAALPSVPRSVQDPLTSNAVNVIGSLNVLLAARDSGVRRVVSASSSSVYGSNPVLPKREDLATQPISPYAVAKLAGENYGRSFHQVYGLETVALRYFNVFGPRQDPASEYAAVIPRFITSYLRGDRPKIFGDGEQSRDFTYVDNVVDANLRAADPANDVAGQAFNVAYGDSYTLNATCALLKDLMDVEVEPEYLPARNGDVLHSRADVGRARESFGYDPRVDFREGLRRCIDYYERQEQGADRK